MKHEFYHQFDLPTTTAQQRRHTRSGKTYMPEKVKLAEATFMAILEQHKPERPLDGCIRAWLSFTWAHTEETKKIGDCYKNTRPDLDDYEKLWWDCVAKCGYIVNDSRIVTKIVTKYHGDCPGVYMCLTEIDQKLKQLEQDDQ